MQYIYVTERLELPTKGFLLLHWRAGGQAGGRLHASGSPILISQLHTCISAPFQVDTGHLLLAIIIEDSKGGLSTTSSRTGGSGARGSSGSGGAPCGFLGLPVTEYDAQAAHAWLCGRRRRSSRGRRSPQLLFSSAAKVAFEQALEVWLPPHYAACAPPSVRDP